MPVSDHCLTRRRPWRGRQWNQCLLGLKHLQISQRCPKKIQRQPIWIFTFAISFSGIRQKAGGWLRFMHTYFHTPTSPPTGSVCKPRRWHPACNTNSGNCWTLLEDYQNTIMYYTSDWLIPHPSIKGALCPQSKRHNYVKFHFRRLSTISTGPSAVPTMICTSSGMGQNSRQQQGAELHLSHPSD